MMSDDLAILEKARRALSDAIARMRPTTPEEEKLKDDLVAKRDAIATEKDRLIETSFEGSIQGLDDVWAQLDGACRKLRVATDRVESAKKVIEIAARVLSVAAKAAAKVG